MLEDRYILLVHKRISGQLSEEERIELDKWIKSDPANMVMVDQLTSVWTKSMAYKPLVNPNINQAKADFFLRIAREEELAMPVSQTKHEFSIRRIYQWTAVAASLLIVSGLFWFYTRKMNDLPSFMEGTELTAEFRNTKSIEMLDLPDGTKIWTKPGTKISISDDFNQEDRVIYLEGDIFARVHHDASKPFQIIMEYGKVEVLGTSFYLSTGGMGEGHLKLIEGKVQFNGLSSQITLIDQGEIVFDAIKDTLIIPESADRLSSDWVNDYLIFENATLQQVFDKLSRHYGVRFTIDCPEIGKMKGFTSFIHQQDDPKINAYLEAIRKVYNLEISKNSEIEYRVTGEPCF
ncbi:MAG TPA: FecR domain-containing protein [Saprospiraceae bacterium]|nr:FecR domain-containing protein [Saprospiraceae bacterium]